MILGIGSDLASIDRIRQVLKDHDARFLARCFASEERDHVEKTGEKSEDLRMAGYAKRWAAKEACAKAMGRGIRDDIFLKDIVVVNDAEGKPSIMLRGGARAQLERLTPPGARAQVHLSLTDELSMAMAFVVIEAQPATG